VLEAWAASTPVAVSNMRGSAELVGEQGAGGLMFDNFSGAAEAIQECLSRRDELGVIGRAKVEERFQWPMLYKKYKRLWAACWNNTQDELIVEARGRGGWL